MGRYVDMSRYDCIVTYVTIHTPYTNHTSGSKEIPIPLNTNWTKVMFKLTEANPDTWT